MKKDSELWASRKVILSACFFAVLYAFWYLACPYVMLHHEGWQMFLWNWDYFSDSENIPGGIARYIGEMISQFFLIPALGAFLLSALIAGLQGVFWKIMQRSGADAHLYPLSFIPSLLITGMVYSGLHTLTFPIGLLVVCSLMLIQTRFAVDRFFITAIGFFVAGPVALITLPYFLLKDHRTKILIWVALGWVYCIWRASLTPYPWISIISGHNYMFSPESFPVYEWIAIAIIALLLGISSKVKCSKIKELHLLLFVIVLAVIIMPMSKNVEKASEMNYEYQVRSNNMEIIPQITSDTSTVVRSNGILFAQISMNSGYVSMAQRYAFEGMEGIPNYNKSAWAIKLLTEIALVTGQIDVARKYLKVLNETTFYRNWAKQIQPLTDNPKLIESNPGYSVLRKAYLSAPDQFFK